MTSQPRPQVGFLQGLTVRHGPQDLLGRFFLRAVEEVRRRGIELSFASFEDLVTVNAANRDTWIPLFPTFDPRFSTLTQENSFCLMGRNRAGEIVTTQAGRLFDWHDSDLGRECEAMRFFYDDPARQCLPDETCEVTATSARQITGKATFIGGLWYRPDVRSLGLSPLMARIGRMYAYTRWLPDFSTAMISDANRALKPAQSGHANVDWEVSLKNSRLGTVRMALIWSTGDWILQDMTEFLAGLESKVDAGVEDRRAQQGA